MPSQAFLFGIRHEFREKYPIQQDSLFDAKYSEIDQVERIDTTLSTDRYINAYQLEAATQNRL